MLIDSSEKSAASFICPVPQVSSSEGFVQAMVSSGRCLHFRSTLETEEHLRTHMYLLICQTDHGESRSFLFAERSVLMSIVERHYQQKQNNTHNHTHKHI